MIRIRIEIGQNIELWLQAKQETQMYIRDTRSLRSDRECQYKSWNQRSTKCLHADGSWAPGR